MSVASQEDGFTLTEALVGLLIISLSLGGLLQAGRVVGHADKAALAQKRIIKSEVMFERELAEALRPIQPITATDLKGDGHFIHYACDKNQKGQGALKCSLNPPLGSLAYVSSGKVYSSWPPAGVLTADKATRLEAVLWHDDAGKNIGVLALPVEQGADCQFEMISRACRQSAPVHE